MIPYPDRRSAFGWPFPSPEEPLLQTGNPVDTLRCLVHVAFECERENIANTGVSREKVGGKND